MVAVDEVARQQRLVIGHIGLNTDNAVEISKPRIVVEVIRNITGVEPKIKTAWRNRCLLPAERRELTSKTRRINQQEKTAEQNRFGNGIHVQIIPSKVIWIFCDWIDGAHWAGGLDEQTVLFSGETRKLKKINQNVSSDSAQ